MNFPTHPRNGTLLPSFAANPSIEIRPTHFRIGSDHSPPLRHGELDGSGGTIDAGFSITEFGGYPSQLPEHRQRIERARKHRFIRRKSRESG